MQEIQNRRCVTVKDWLRKYDLSDASLFIKALDKNSKICENYANPLVIRFMYFRMKPTQCLYFHSRFDEKKDKEPQPSRVGLFLGLHSSN